MQREQEIFFISVKHLGYISGGVEDTSSERLDSCPSIRKLHFLQLGDDTKFEVDTDIEEDYVEMFSELWPKALKSSKTPWKTIMI